MLQTKVGFPGARRGGGARGSCSEAALVPALWWKHEAPGPGSLPAAISGPGPGMGHVLGPASGRAWGGVLCLRSLGFRWTGVMVTCPVDVWVLIGVSCLRLPFSSLLTTCKRARCWLSCPVHPAPASSWRAVPREPPGPAAFPLWGLRGSLGLTAVPHGRHQGAPEPWRAGGWTLVAQQGEEAEAGSCGGSQQQPGGRHWRGPWRPTLPWPSSQLSGGLWRLGCAGAPAALQELSAPGSGT